VRIAQRSLALRPAHSRGHLYVTCYTEGFSHFVTSITAPVASGWSVRRVGLAPTGKRRLLTTHVNSGRSPTKRRRGANRPNSARQCVLSKRRKALIVSTWGTAVVRAFHTAAQGGPLGVAHEQSAGAVVAVHARPAAAAHGRPEAAVVHEPSVVAVHARPAAPHGRQAAAVAHGQPAAVAPHEQLGAMGEPLVAAAGHGRPAAPRKARER
jgi:hypothetical protein